MDVYRGRGGFQIWSKGSNGQLILTSKGMIKYNYSGPGLTDGLRDQVVFLTQTLKDIPSLSYLHVRLKDDAKVPETAQRVLEPLLGLRNVRKVVYSGDVLPDFARRLEEVASERSAKW